VLIKNAKTWPITLILFTLCAITSAASPPKHAVSKMESNPAVQPCVSATVYAVPNKRGTSEQPLVVQSPKDEAKEADDHSLAVWTRWLGIATFALVAVGFGQFLMFWQQLRLMVDGAKDAAISARAAQKSAEIAERSLTQLERPHVFAHVRTAGIRVVQSSDGQGQFERDMMELVIYNFGRTPAQLTHIEYKIGVADHGDILSPVDRLQVLGRSLPIGTISANGDPFTETVSMKLQFLQEEIDILQRRKSIWIVGFVRYVDLLGNHRINGFSEVLDVWVGKYIRRGSEIYNYAADELEGDIPSQQVAEDATHV
jgi:hypothetical protein